MINGHGSGDRDHCVLDFDNILPVIQYLHPTNEEDVTVVDIGSGWGSCARQLALLGYKVYSIDLEPEHIEWQKQHFCSMPPFDTFIYKYWQMEKPEKLEEEQFQRYCSTVAKTNIKYISGNFADKKILEQIPDSKWNIVLALNSLQFFNKTDLHLTLNTINEYLDNKGLFIAVTKGKDQYYYSHDIYDFDISNYLGTLFKNYVILTAAFDHDIGRFRIVTLYKNNTK